jgi:hypothetical protein
MQRIGVEAQSLLFYDSKMQTRIWEFGEIFILVLFLVKKRREGCFNTGSSIKQEGGDETGGMFD